VNPDFLTLRNQKHRVFICLQAFEKIRFAHPNRNADDSLQLQRPRLPGTGLSTATAPGQAKAWKREWDKPCSYPTSLPTWGSCPAKGSIAEAKHNRIRDSAVLQLPSG